MMKRTNDKSRGTLILDLLDFRAIVYKVGSVWLVRVGRRQLDRIAPLQSASDSLVSFSGEYSTKRAAVLEAEARLKLLDHA
jgi:hypothetical protein